MPKRGNQAMGSRLFGIKLSEYNEPHYNIFRSVISQDDHRDWDLDCRSTRELALDPLASIAYIRQSMSRDTLLPRICRSWWKAHSHLILG